MNKKSHYKSLVSLHEAPTKNNTTNPPPLSSILKKSDSTPVPITSTPIVAENIICFEYKTISLQWAKQQREDTLSSPPPPQTAPATGIPDNNEETTEYPPSLPEDLDVIEEFSQPDDNDDYIPLMSAIALKKKKIMLFLTVEFHNVKIDALVDSGAYINDISGRHA